MKTHQILLFLSFLFSGLVCAEQNPIKLAQQEQVAFIEHARGMLYDYQNGKPAHSLMAHYLNEANYVHFKPSLSVQQHERIIKLAQAFDAARGLVTGLENTLSVQQCFANLRHEFENIKKSVLNAHHS